MNIEIFCGKNGCEGMFVVGNIGVSGFGVAKADVEDQWERLKPVIQRFFDEHRHEGEEDDDDGGPLGHVTGEDPASHIEEEKIELDPPHR